VGRLVTALLLIGVLSVATVPRLTGSRIQNIPDQTPFQDASAVVGAMKTVSNAQQQLRGTVAQGINAWGTLVKKNEIQETERLAKDADNAFTKFRREKLFGSDDGTVPGYYSLRGEDAVNEAPRVKQEIEAERTRLAGTLTNEKARMLYDNASKGTLDDSFRSLNRFTIKEQQSAQVASSEARIAEGYQDALQGALINDKGAVIRSLSKVVSEVHDQAELRGLGDEATQSLLELHRSNMLAGVVTGLVKNGRITEANIFLDGELVEGTGITVKDLMDPDVAANTVAMLAKHTDLAFVQSEADAYMVAGGDETSTIATVRSRDDITAQQEADIVKELKVRFDEKAAQVKAQTAAAIDSVTGAISASGGRVSWRDVANSDPENAAFWLDDADAIKMFEDHRKRIVEGNTDLIMITYCLRLGQLGKLPIRIARTSITIVMLCV
jgi:hypothetical protein